MGRWMRKRLGVDVTVSLSVWGTRNGYGRLHQCSSGGGGGDDGSSVVPSATDLPGPIAVVFVG